MNESNNTEWLVQPKRVCQTWFLLLSYLRYKWSCGEETGLISDKTSNPWAPYVEKSIADFERGLTQRAADWRVRRGLKAKLRNPPTANANRWADARPLERVLNENYKF